MHSSRRSCSGRAAVSWVPWLAVVLLAIFSLVQLRGRGKTDAPAAPPVESAARSAAPAAAGTSTPATAEVDLAHALVLDEEFMAASQGLRKTREALEAIGPVEHPRVALDLSGLDFIDSASTGALVHLREVIETERGGNLVLCGLKRVVRRVLDVTGLACRFDIREDRADAVAHLTDS